MAYATSISTPVARRLDGARYGASPCDNSTKAWWDICYRPDQDICLEDGEFMLEGPRGVRRIGRFTGRTRWIGNFCAATIEVYEVDTVVEMVGDLPVIVGRRGERLKGTWWTHPNASFALASA